MYPRLALSPSQVENKYIELHARAGLPPPNFPTAYPSAALLGCVRVKDCLPHDEWMRVRYIKNIEVYIHDLNRANNKLCELIIGLRVRVNPKLTRGVSYG